MTDAVVDEANTVDDGKIVDDVKMAGENASGDSGMEDTDEKLSDDDVRVE